MRIPEINPRFPILDREMKSWDLKSCRRLLVGSEELKLEELEVAELEINWLSHTYTPNPKLEFSTYSKLELPRGRAHARNSKLEHPTPSLNSQLQACTLNSKLKLEKLKSWKLLVCTKSFYDFIGNEIRRTSTILNSKLELPTPAWTANSNLHR